MKTAKSIDLTDKNNLMKVVHSSLSNGIRSAKSTAPREWLEKKALSIESTGATFNSGQIHHRREQAFKEALESIGLLKRSNAATNAGQIPYTSFGKSAILFPLRDENREVVNFYAMSIEKNKNAYLNEEGIYPCFPHEKTTTLYITDTILDAATLLESKIMDNRQAVMALNDGTLKSQHKTALESLKDLKEIIYLGKK
jgi:hypothetical protein